MHPVRPLGISPGITVTDQPQTITLGSDARIGSVAGFSCPEVPEHFGAVVTATFDAPSLYCANATSDNDPLVMDVPASGKVKIRWPNGDRSVWRAHVSLASTSPQTMVWSGTIARGVYAGDRVTARTDFASTTNGHCQSGEPPITAMSFGAGLNARPERLLTFSHTA